MDEIEEKYGTIYAENYQLPLTTVIAKLERETERRILLELEVKKLCARFSVALPDIVSSSPSHHNSFSHSPAYPSTPPEARSGGEKKEKGGSSGGGGKDGKRRGNRVVGRKARARVRSPTRTPPLPTTKRTRRSPPRPRPSPEGKRRRGGKERVDHSSFIFQDDAEADFVSSSSSSSSLSSSSGVLLLPSNTEPDPVVSLIHTDEDEGAGNDSFSHAIDTRDGTHEHRRGHRHPTRTPTSPSPPTPSPSPPPPNPQPPPSIPTSSVAVEREDAGAAEHDADGSASARAAETVADGCAQRLERIAHGDGDVQVRDPSGALSPVPARVSERATVCPDRRFDQAPPSPQPRPHALILLHMLLLLPGVGQRRLLHLLSLWRSIAGSQILATLGFDRSLRSLSQLRSLSAAITGHTAPWIEQHSRLGERRWRGRRKH